MEVEEDFQHVGTDRDGERGDGRCLFNVDVRVVRWGPRSYARLPDFTLCLFIRS